MHTQRLTFSSLVALALYVGTAAAVRRDCHRNTSGRLGTSNQGSSYLCEDGKSCTPYCGVGSCNIFGCNCDNGCRTNGRRSSIGRDLDPQDESKSYFDAVDSNHDGMISYAEWTEHALTKRDMAAEDLAARWAQYDSDGNGYLTADEAVMRKV